MDGAGGPPVPSWDTLGIGGKQGGIILPQRHPRSGAIVSYLTTQQTSMATTDKPSELLWYDNDPNGPTFHTRPRKQAEFLVQTEFRNFEDCSDNKKESAAKNELEDDGIRRVIIKGKTATDSFFKATRAVFGPGAKPEVGAFIWQTLTGKRKKGDFKENVIEVTFEKATPASLAIVQAFAEEAGEDFAPLKASPAAKPSDDPWATVGDESGDKPGF